MLYKVEISRKERTGKYKSTTVKIFFQTHKSVSFFNFKDIKLNLLSHNIKLAV